MASKETVKRLSPAAASDLAFADKAAPFVVTATSRGFPFQVLSLESSSIRNSMPFLSRGSPPVKRIFSMPFAAKILARRMISSKERTSVWERKQWSFSNFSFGMQ